ncbi:hypothetical protein DPX16_18795 [Anabarilius grahami]|uniref:PHD-type domain-containing protein n=1 Tax=Anabarilius grahami TaxID=495550 RepID=A0A3N0Y1V3_ANAGA|nr:hypothetical protein DPX16_18795 [Anabarilius grahami]
MFGREARYPCQVPTDYEICHGKVKAMVASEQLSDGLSDRRETMEAVKQKISNSQEKVRKRKMEMGQDDNFMAGDKVLVRNVRQENRKGGKMDPDMLGPFTIVKIEEKNVDVVSTKGKKIMKFNMDHLVKYVEPEPHIPKKWIPSAPLIPPPPASSPNPATLLSHASPSLSFTEGLSAPISPTSQCLKVISSPQPTTTHLIHNTMAQIQINPVPPTPHSYCPDTFSESTNLEEQVIRDIWDGKKQEVLWSKMGPYKLYTKNLMGLAPGKWLESELAELLLMEEEITFSSNEEGVVLICMEIAKRLLRETDDLSKLCRSCGEKHGHEGQTDQWIECGRWYHWDCVGRPSTVGKYSCPACM